MKEKLIRAVDQEGPFTKKFQRRCEDFICFFCAAPIQGTGYTNHCPKCLHSKHVDINPGDRKAICQGQMVPIAKGLDQKGYYVVHQCQGCFIEKKNKITLAEQSDYFINLPWHEIR